ncbi:MAG: TatD family hydrolase [Anaerolineales bacterium]
MKLVDTHCHLDFDAYRDDLDQVLERAWEADVERVLVPALDLTSSRRVLDLVESNPRLFAAVGVHPNRAREWTEGTPQALLALSHHPKVKAIGEIGLDYYRDRAPRDLQKRVLKRQLTVASQRGLPVVLHVRNANPDDRSCIIDLLDILATWRREADQGVRAWVGVVHSFSGNVEEAQRAISLGFALGVTGPVTFEKSTTMQEVVTSSPLTSLMIETDGPFLTPHPHRGKRNEPAYVKYVAEKVADLQDRPVREVGKVTTENADHLFHWR